MKAKPGNGPESATTPGPVDMTQLLDATTLASDFAPKPLPSLGDPVRKAARGVAEEIAALVVGSDKERERILKAANEFAEDVVRIGDEHAAQLESILNELKILSEHVAMQRAKFMKEAPKQ